jgi:hypothetical protein
VARLKARFVIGDDHTKKLYNDAALFSVKESALGYASAWNDRAAHDAHLMGSPPLHQPGTTIAILGLTDLDDRRRTPDTHCCQGLRR